jgi:elongation factor Tu
MGQDPSLAVRKTRDSIAAMNTPEQAQRSRIPTIGWRDLLWPSLCSLLSALAFLFPACLALLSIDFFLDLIMPPSGPAHFFDAAFVYSAAGVVVLAYLFVGAVSGFVVPLTTTFMKRTGEFVDSLNQVLEPSIKSAIDRFRLDSFAFVPKTCEDIFGARIGAAFKDAAEAFNRVPFGQKLQAYLFGNVVATLHLSLARDFVSWMQERGEKRVSFSVVEAFLRERLSNRLVNECLSVLGRTRKRAFRIGEVFVLLPCVTAIAILLFGDTPTRAIGFAPVVWESIVESISPVGTETREPATGAGAGTATVANKTDETSSRSAWCTGIKSDPTKRSASAVEGPLPHANLVAFGATQPEVPLLSSAMLKVLRREGRADYRSPECLLDAPVETNRGIPIPTTRVEYETSRRHYAQAFMPTLSSFQKAMITGATQADGGVLVVSRNEGVTVEIREQMTIARWIGVPAIVVFIDLQVPGDPSNKNVRAVRDLLKMIVDGETIDARTEELISEIKDLLHQSDFSGDSPIVVGSAGLALGTDARPSDLRPVSQLLEAIDNHVPQPVRPKDRPFLMPVEDVFMIEGRGLVATGRVERGVIKVGDEIEVVGLGDTITTTCAGVEMFRKLLDQGEAGDNIGMVLAEIGKGEVSRGQVLAKPGTVGAHRRFRAMAYLLSEEEKGRSTPISSGYRPQFYFRTTDVTGTLDLLEAAESAMPGDVIFAEVQLIQAIAMEKGLRFAIREGGRTVGAGVVSEIIE